MTHANSAKRPTIENRAITCRIPIICRPSKLGRRQVRSHPECLLQLILPRANRDKVESTPEPRIQRLTLRVLSKISCVVHQYGLISLANHLHGQRNAYKSWICSEVCADLARDVFKVWAVKKLCGVHYLPRPERLGTLSPLCLASLRAMALIWAGLLTIGPFFDPLCNLPAYPSRITCAIFDSAFFEYFLAIISSIF